jgi:hypothetical protein
MFTLKVFSPSQQASCPSYRCIAVSEFEVSPATEPGKWLTLLMTRLDGTMFEWQLEPGVDVFVENASGQTIDKLRYIAPRAPN